MMRGARTALDLLTAAVGLSDSFDAFGDPPLRLTGEPLLALFGGDLRFICYNLTVTT